MLYRQAFSILLILLVACSNPEQATNTTPVTIEAAKEIADATEKEYYSNKSRSTNNISPERHENTLDRKHFEILGFSLGYSSFNDVLKKFGKAPLVKGESDHDGATVCYTAQHEGDMTLIVFWSWYDTLNTIKIYGDKNKYGSKNNCVKSNLIKSDVATLSGIRLFLSKSELEKLIMAPPLSNHQKWSL